MIEDYRPRVLTRRSGPADRSDVAMHAVAFRLWSPPLPGVQP